MANINGIYKQYEGTDAQCSGVQLNRETTWATDIGSSGTLRYVDCSGNVHYIYPGEPAIQTEQYFYAESDLSKGSGVYYSGPSGINDYIRLGSGNYVQAVQSNGLNISGTDGLSFSTTSGSIIFNKYARRSDDPAVYSDNSEFGLIGYPNEDSSSHEFYFRSDNHNAGYYKNFRVLGSAGGEYDGCLLIQTPGLISDYGASIASYLATNETGVISYPLDEQYYTSLSIIGKPLDLIAPSGYYGSISLTNYDHTILLDHTGGPLSLSSNSSINLSGADGVVCRSTMYIYGENYLRLGTYAYLNENQDTGKFTIKSDSGDVLLKSEYEDVNIEAGSQVNISGDYGVNITSYHEFNPINITAIDDVINLSGTNGINALSDLDLNGNRLILDDDGDTYLQSESDDLLYLRFPGSGYRQYFYSGSHTRTANISNTETRACYSTGSEYCSKLQFDKSHSTSISTNITTISSEWLGQIEALGRTLASGSATSSRIVFAQDNTSTADSVPGRISFFTSSGVYVLPERLRITSTGEIRILGNKLVLDADNDTSIQCQYDDTIHFNITNALRAGLTTSGYSIYRTAESPISSIYAYSDTNSHAGTLKFIKSHSDTINVNATTVDGETLGVIEIEGRTSSPIAASTAAQIKFIQDGDSTASGVPSAMKFYSSNGTTNDNLRMNISAAGPIYVYEDIHISQDLAVVGNTMTGGLRLDPAVKLEVGIGGEAGSPVSINATNLAMLSVQASGSYNYYTLVSGVEGQLLTVINLGPDTAYVDGVQMGYNMWASGFYLLLHNGNDWIKSLS
jgi:hypothetical protein